MRKTRILSLLVLLLAVICMCCACGKSDGKVYSDSAVKRYAKEQCPNENFKQISKEKISDNPTHYQHKFKTDRGLVFTVDNYLGEFDGFFFKRWRKELNCDYSKKIMDLYHDDARAVMSQYEKIESKNSWAYIDEYADIEPLVNQIMKAEKVFEPELKYNDKEFLASLNCVYLHIVHFPSEEARLQHKNWTNITTIYINGGHSREEILTKIRDRYLKLVKNGEIKDDTVSSELLDTVQ